MSKDNENQYEFEEKMESLEENISCVEKYNRRVYKINLIQCIVVAFLYLISIGMCVHALIFRAVEWHIIAALVISVIGIGVAVFIFIRYYKKLKKKKK